MRTYRRAKLLQKITLVKTFQPSQQSHPNSAESMHFNKGSHLKLKATCKLKAKWQENMAGIHVIKHRVWRILAYGIPFMENNKFPLPCEKSLFPKWQQAEVDQETVSTPAEHQGPAGVPPPGIKSRDRDMETNLGQQRESVNCFFGAQEKISERNIFRLSLGISCSSIQKG